MGNPTESGLLGQLQHLPTAQKITLAAVLALVLVVSLVLVHWSGTPDFVVVYSGTDSSAVSKASATLADQGIPYKLGADGTTITVPQPKAAAARLALGTGSATSGKALGFELFDKPNFAASQFVEQINFQRALEGELANTIQQLDWVQSASVHLVLPEESPFVEETEPASCSVLISPMPGAQVSPAQVAGVTDLVCYSVRGLSPEKVSVVDGAGHVLSTTAVAEASQGPASGRLLVQRRYESELAAKLETMLTALVGAGNALVRVNATLDLDSVQQTANRIEPASGSKGVPVTSEFSEESHTGGGGASGVPGTASNQPGATAYAGGATGAEGQYERSEERTEYEVSRVTENTVKAPGKLESLSIAVLINDAALSLPKRSAIERAVTSAAGLDDLRGDKLTVTGLSFAKAPDDSKAADQATPKTAQLLEKGLVFLPVALALIVLMVLMKLVKGFSQPVTTATPRAGTGQAGAAPQAQSAAAVTQGKHHGPMVRELDDDDVLDLAPDSKLGKSRLIASEHQERAVAVLRTWLME